MATKTFDKIAGALAHLAVVRQATDDAEIRGLCADAASTIKTKVDEIVIFAEVDPAADLKLIKFDSFYDAISECNSIADKSSSPIFTCVMFSWTIILQKAVPSTRNFKASPPLLINLTKNSLFIGSARFDLWNLKIGLDCASKGLKISLEKQRVLFYANPFYFS